MINKVRSISDSKYIIIFSDFVRNITNIDQFNDILINSEKLVKELVKQKYTIIIPTYNFNFPNKKVTSFSKNFVTSGFFNKYLLEKFNFKRTKKPMYNYAVIGQKSKRIVELNQTTAWGRDSVISFLTRHNCIGIGINIDVTNFGWVTIHSCEEDLKVPYRYYKKFAGKNIETKKLVYEKMYVRKLNMKLNTKPKNLMKKLNKNKIKTVKYKFHKVSIINLNEIYKLGCKMLSKDILSLAK